MKLRKLRFVRGSSFLVFLLLISTTGIAQGNLDVWGTVPSPSRGNKASDLKGIDAVAGDDIWAVGEFNPGIPPTETGRRTLIEHWNGTSWSVVRSPNPNWEGLDYATLEAVDDVASNDVWAVGYSEDFASLRLNTLATHWDGTRWRIFPTPNPAGINQPNQLFGVAAVTTENVWAVGRVGLNSKPLTLHWDGTRWQAVRNNCGSGALHGVTAISATDIWAVGEGISCHYDGANWTAVPVPPANGSITIFDVSASTSNDVWAVGQYIYCVDEHCDAFPYAIHWNGSQWQATNPPGVILSGVLALAPNNVFAVGTYSVGTLIIRWDGSQWATVASPDPETGGFLNEIAATNSGELWAVGSYYTFDYKEKTLVEQAPSKTQGTLVGNTNVADAVVSWIGPVNGSTSTDISGHYQAAGLPAGRYSVIVSYGGCNPDAANVDIVAGEITTQDFHLQCSQ
jgi:carboxypeptidase family protein